MQAKKSLGQNFLKSKAAIADIIKAAELTKDNIVLEVGPGKGVLTEALLEKAGKVIAVEKDDRLIEVLEEKFAAEIKAGKFQIIHQDILEFDPKEAGLVQGKYKLVANIPYYITGQLFRLFLQSDHQPSLLVLMVQKEVAKRIVASDGKESILSLSVKVYGTPKYISKVPAKYFSPAPRVDSAILKVSDISKKVFTENKIDELSFFELIKTGFAHKRKLVIKNLESLYNKDMLLKIFTELSIPTKERSETLSLETWKSILVRITDHLQN